jgi:general secretion pathway protein I
MLMRQRGFSLLEVLVAFSILALSLGVLMQIFSGALRNTDITHGQAQAVTLAQSLLATAGVEGTLVEGEVAGSLDNEMRWLMRISPFLSGTIPGESSATLGGPPLDLFEVTVQVAWGDTSVPDRTVTLTTLRLQPRSTTP